MRFTDKIRHSPWYFALALLKSPRLRRSRRIALEVYERLGIRDKLAFDIGASMGGRTELMLALGCKVVAVEPDPAAFEILTCRFGNHRNATLIQKGAGENPGTKTLYQCGTSTLSTFSEEDRDSSLADGRFSNRDRTYDASRQVEITTLNALIGEFGVPYFCKISTIGYEKYILAGLSHPIPVISYTINLPHQIEAGIECCDKLASLDSYSSALIFSDFANGFHLNCWYNHTELRKQLADLSRSRPGNSSYVEVYCIDSAIFDTIHLPKAT